MLNRIQVNAENFDNSNYNQVVSHVTDVIDKYIVQAEKFNVTVMGRLFNLTLKKEGIQRAKSYKNALVSMSENVPQDEIRKKNLISKIFNDCAQRNRLDVNGPLGSSNKLFDKLFDMLCRFFFSEDEIKRVKKEITNKNKLFIIAGGGGVVEIEQRSALLKNIGEKMHVSYGRMFDQSLPKI